MVKNNWRVKKLGEIADIYGGGTPRRSNPAYWDNDIPWLTMKDVNSKFYVTGTVQFISNLGLEKSNAQLVPSGSVILSSTASVGNVAINTIPLATNQQFNSFHPKENVIVEYLAYYLIFSKDKIKSLGGSTTFQFISKATISNFEIPLPSIYIQKKIVKKLNAIRKAQELCDQQIQKTEELFESIIFKEIDIDLGRQALRSIIKLSSGKFMPSKNQNPNGKIPVYGGNGINGFTDLPLTVDHTVVIGRVGAYCGNVHLISSSSWISDNAIYVKEYEKEKITLEFLYYFLFVSNLHKLSGISGQPKITQDPILNIKLNLPDLKTQRKIVEKLEVAQNYKKLLQGQKALFKELFDSVLDKSMKGEMDY